MGYIMGQAEGIAENWHGHVTAVTVAPDSIPWGRDSISCQYIMET